MATKLVSMKITKAELAAKRKEYATAGPSDGEAYPYGLTVRLDNDALEKLELDAGDYAVGDEVMLVAICEVCETSSRESLVGGASQNLSLQITQMCLEEKPKKVDTKNAAAVFYKG